MPESALAHATCASLFDTNDDNFLVMKLSRDAGLYDLEVQLSRKDPGIRLRLFAPQCSPGAAETVRKHLDGPVLEKLHAAYMASADDPSKCYRGNLWPYPGKFNYKYAVILLGACAMSLGCTLSSSFLDDLNALYGLHPNVSGLRLRAHMEMHAALGHAGPQPIFFRPAFVNGTPLEFDMSKPTREAFVQVTMAEENQSVYKGLQAAGQPTFASLKSDTYKQEVARAIEMFRHLDTEQGLKWGDGLFESDLFIDKVNRLSVMFGLLQIQASEACYGKPQFSVFQPLCSSAKDAARVRSTVHDLFIGRHARLMFALQSMDRADQPREGMCFSILVLGLCAISFGVQIPDVILEDLQRLFLSTSMQSKKANKQLKKILYGSLDLTGGKPYHPKATPRPVLMLGTVPFDKATKAERKTALAKQKVFDDDVELQKARLILVPSGTREEWDKVIAKVKKTAGNQATKEEMHEIYKSAVRYGNDVCGNCGTPGKDGEDKAEKLKTCARCRKTKYCGAECQKKHWGAHSLVCVKAPAKKA